jgi:tetratricopeptide (TPR) repeat protein
MKKTARGRAKTRRLVAGIMILATLGAIGRKSAPWVKREIQLHLAGREIARGRLADAEARLDLMVHEEPNRTRARLLLVQALRRQGRITEAEEILQRTIEVGLPVEEARREFALLSAWQDFPRAEKSLRRVLEAHPDDEEIRQALFEGRSRANRSLVPDEGSKAPGISNRSSVTKR